MLGNVVGTWSGLAQAQCPFAFAYFAATLRKSPGNILVICGSKFTNDCFSHCLRQHDTEDGTAFASRVLLATRGRARIDRLIEPSGLSARHFQRRFMTQVGLSPKLYARTIRFDAALSAHRRDPIRTWTEIAHEAGYCGFTGSTISSRRVIVR
jgi:AraC-like DNA-binding protein